MLAGRAGRIGGADFSSSVSSTISTASPATRPSLIKQFAENEHAVGQSSLESYLRLTNRVTNGEQVTVFGYGACGRGVAASFRGACARVTVVDVNPVTRLRAHLDGFSTPSREQAIASADVIITVGNCGEVCQTTIS